MPSGGIPSFKASASSSSFRPERCPPLLQPFPGQARERPRSRSRPRGDDRSTASEWSGSRGRPSVTHPGSTTARRTRRHSSRGTRGEALRTGRCRLRYPPRGVHTGVSRRPRPGNGRGAAPALSRLARRGTRSGRGAGPCPPDPPRQCGDVAVRKRPIGGRLLERTAGGQRDAHDDRDRRTAGQSPSRTSSRPAACCTTRAPSPSCSVVVRSACCSVSSCSFSPRCAPVR